MSNNQYTLYEYICKEILNQNLTINDFSKQIGINPITIKRIKMRKPTEKILVKIANGLNKNAWELSQLPITKD